MAEIGTCSTREIICPYCGSQLQWKGEFPNPYDETQQIRCGDCNKLFRWRIDPLTYTSWKPTVHDLKIEPKYWLAVYKGEKTFEIRLNDRQFKVGDIVHLHSFFEGGYTHDPVIERQITYITDYAQKHGYVVFGMKPVEED